jgi:hypothetical protein
MKRSRPRTAVSLRERLRTQLALLKMPGALEALDDRLRRSGSGELAGGRTIDHLLGAHIRFRNAGRLQTAMRSARLSAVRTPADFHFTLQGSARSE